MRPKLLIVDPIHSDGLSEICKRYDVVQAMQPSTDDLERLISDKDAIILRSGVTLDRSIFAKAKRLRLVLRAGSGLDNICLESAKLHGVEVFNTPQASALSVAEHTIGLILAISRKIALADRQLRIDKWSKAELYGSSLQGKVLGLLGFGQIGAHVGRIAQGFDMKVVVSVNNSSELRKKELKKQNIDMASFEELLRISDIISLHLPLTEKTHSLISSDQFKSMKQSAIFVNTARGKIVCEMALYEALLKGEIAGAALDVFEMERQRSKLFDLDNVVATPHIGAMTFDAQRNISMQLLDKLQEKFAIS